VADREERKARRLKKLALKELPNQLDAARLDAGLRDLPKAAREAITEAIRGSQANFDHMNGEMKRATDYHNEAADEVNFLKDELDHDHPGFNTKSVSGFDALAIENGETGMWLSPNNFGSGTRAGVDAYSVPTLVPTYIEKPCVITQLRVYINTDASGADQDVKFFIYAGDYDGNWPDTLLLDLTDDPAVVDGTGTYCESSEFELPVGAGWLWLGICTTRSDSSPDLEIDSWDNGWNTVAHSESRITGFWPFPTEEWVLDTGFVGYFMSISGFNFDLRDFPGPPDPLPGAAGAEGSSFMDDWVNVQSLTSPFYNSYAPVIDYRVKDD